MKLLDRLNLKLNNYLVIDDFFPEKLSTQLQQLTLKYDGRLHQWPDYQAINFDREEGDLSLKMIAEEFVCPKVSFLKKDSYDRAWSLRFNTTSNGVGPHTDPSYYTVNVWVTPDDSVADENKNGLKIYRKKRPRGDWEIYNNWGKEQIEEYLKDVKYDIVPYRFNRAVIFRGDTYHETNSVEMRPGIENVRVSYAFLYNK